MKKFCLIFAFTASVCAADYDLIKGIDLTGVVGGPTYSQLNQLVDNGIINTNNKGLIFVTAGNTNPTATPFGRSGMTNFLWLNRNTDPPSLYAYSATYGWTNVSTVGSVGTAQLNDGAVTGIKIANQTITDTNIFNGTITQTKLSPASYNSGFLIDGAIASNKIANAGIQSSNIAPLAITAALIATNTITSNQVALGGLSWTNMQGAMPSNWLGADAVNGSKVLDRSLSNADIVTNSITSNEVAIAGISATNLATNVLSLVSRAWFQGKLVDSTDTFTTHSAQGCSIARSAESQITITFSPVFLDTNYAAIITSDGQSDQLSGVSYKIITKNTSTLVLNFIASANGGPFSANTLTNFVSGVFFGAQ